MFVIYRMSKKPPEDYYTYERFRDEVDLKLGTTKFGELTYEVGLCIRAFYRIKDICTKNRETMTTKMKDKFGEDVMPTPKPVEKPTEEEIDEMDLSNNPEFEKDSSGNIVKKSENNKKGEKGTGFKKAVPKGTVSGSNKKDDTDFTDSDFMNKEKEIIDYIYKKIAIKCHPDKTTDPNLHKIFVVTNSSKNKMNIVQLLYLFDRVGVEDIDICDDYAKCVMTRVDEMYRLIDVMKKSNEYKWNSLTEDEKDMHLTLFKAKADYMKANSK
tara:strand:+ start:2549 stop:3355 length:807 start_codon:yes stop_codon:yes gene_type:complete